MEFVSVGSTVSSGFVHARNPSGWDRGFGKQERKQGIVEHGGFALKGPR
jgi:hypothetical protein